MVRLAGRGKTLANACPTTVRNVPIHHLAGQTVSAAGRQLFVFFPQLPGVRPATGRQADFRLILDV